MKEECNEQLSKGPRSKNIHSTRCTGQKKAELTKEQRLAKRERAHYLRKKRWLIEKRRKQARRQTIRLALVSIGSGLLFMGGVFFYFFSVTKVYGYSMLPTLADGELVIINRQKEIGRYQLIAFYTEKGDIIVRRVIGLPGEKVELRQDKLYVNDEERVEFYLPKESIQAENSVQSSEASDQEVEGIQSVPENTYYVLGDNRAYATDSRYFGPVSKEKIVGVILMQTARRE
ncbi:signal peptidase I [Enterococcus sp. AZ194]|uniref:signal peptidase I n=1 Tax=Enterococcus sp. AZ194 TaxID=2774629 RepID=UPI003F1F740D